MTQRAYFFDLDGTLANLDHRLHHITGEVKDWRAFFANVFGDEPIGPIVTLLNSLATNGDPCVILSGRSDECREQTMMWLERHIATWNIWENPIYMRKEGDHRPDHEIKKELLAQAQRDGFEPILFIDDRKQVVDMWRGLGYVCLQCAPGDF